MCVYPRRFPLNKITINGIYSMFEAVFNILFIRFIPIFPRYDGFFDTPTNMTNLK